jgi:hypothetical protein
MPSTQKQNGRPLAGTANDLNDQSKSDLKCLLHVDGLLGGGLEVGNIILGVAPLLGSLSAHLNRNIIKQKSLLLWENTGMRRKIRKGEKLEADT